jgi:hypothetical protein
MHGHPVLQRVQERPLISHCPVCHSGLLLARELSCRTRQDALRRAVGKNGKPGPLLARHTKAKATSKEHACSGTCWLGPQKHEGHYKRPAVFFSEAVLCRRGREEKGEAAAYNTYLVVMAEGGPATLVVSLLFSLILPHNHFTSPPRISLAPPSPILLHTSYGELVSAAFARPNPTIALCEPRSFKERSPSFVTKRPRKSTRGIEVCLSPHPAAPILTEQVLLHVRH